MSGITLVATGEEPTEATLIAAAEGHARFVVSAELCHDIKDDAPYLHTRVWFGAPDENEGFGEFHLVIDRDGALQQMAVGSKEAEVARAIRERLMDNDIVLGPTGMSLVAGARPSGHRSVLSARCDEGWFELRAKAHPAGNPDDESLIVLRFAFEPFGCLHVVISDLGRVLAMATGRRDRDAYERVRHDVERRDLSIDQAVFEGGSS